MTDLRAAILARCDELEKLARAASGWLLDDEGDWSRDAAGVMRERLIFVQVGGEVPSSGPRWVTSMRGASVVPLVAAFDPAAVLGLVAGAREMVAIHNADNWALSYVAPDNRDCEGCGFGEGAEWLRYMVGACPTLRATARMLGVEVTDG